MKEKNNQLTFNNKPTYISLRRLKMRKGFLLSIILTAMALFWVGACDNDYPDSLWDPDASGLPDPIITSVSPSDSTLDGVGIVTIHGHNFSANMAENLVFFNSGKATIFEDLSDTTKLVVQAPVVIKDATVNEMDSIKIRVAVQGAYMYGVYPATGVNFKLKRANIEWGTFALEKLHAIDSDKDGNVYIASEEKNTAGAYIIYKITPDNVKSEFGSVIFNTAPGMKVGWGGALFITRINNKTIYRIPATGGAAAAFNSGGLPGSGKAADIDFDQNVLYAVGTGTQGAVFTVTSAGVATACNQYIGFNLVATKVYNGYLYVAGKYTGTDTTIPTEGIWRSPITDNAGTLGTRELVFDWATFVGTGGQTLLSITMDINGNIYAGMKEAYTSSTVSGTTTITYAGGTVITVIAPDGTTSSLYPELLYAPATYFSFTSGTTLWVVRNPENQTATGVVKNRLFKLEMTTTGAPYYGRNL
ncbi:MAG: IPT/TIG domain-containing protein [Candidatus Marinimicrobia bacterium]|nr:IPT/TIG domain-containing protein [Candidatus Neomarinimicrobiota bacterium]